MAIEDKSQKMRPVNLDLRTLHFPLPAIISILHRLSGLFLFLCIPFLLWILNLSLTSSDNFRLIQSWFSKLPIKIVLWGMLLALIYHTLAGFRHFVMDCGYAESLKMGRISAWCVLGLTVLFGILSGIWLW